MRYEITAPARGFDGEVAGVRFSRGRATADSSQDQAALGYFRRKGYTIVAVAEPETVAEEDGPEPGWAAGPAEPPPGPEYFDPGAHSVAEVLAYLDLLVADSDDYDRVIAAEKAGKARTTILARAGSEGDDQK